MTYPDSVRYLYSLGNELKVGAKWGLERMRTLLSALENPEHRGRFIHVAGTNGKGSTCAMIASSMQAAGYRTGLFTSPHLVSPTERIQIDGKAISEDDFGAAFSAVHAAAVQLEAEGAIDAQPSYFETVTAMALLVFSGLRVRRCDVTVMEVGLGGRLDATNVIAPELCVITPISFDHESFLGNTLASIAAEKAGIIKHGVPVIIAPQRAAAEQVIRQRAAEMEAVVTVADSKEAQNALFTAPGCTFALGETSYQCRLPGRHQLDNAVTAIAACKAFGLRETDVQTGLAAATWPGRIEYVSAAPDFVLDGAHNPAGADALARYIREFCSGRPVWLVYGTMRDKAINEVVECLFPLADRLILTAPSLARALRPEAVQELSGRTDALIMPTIDEAIAVARTAPPEAIVFFTGSLFVVGEARRALLRKME